MLRPIWLQLGSFGLSPCWKNESILKCAVQQRPFYTCHKCISVVIFGTKPTFITLILYVRVVLLRVMSPLLLNTVWLCCFLLRGFKHCCNITSVMWALWSQYAFFSSVISHLSAYVGVLSLCTRRWGRTRLIHLDEGLSFLSRLARAWYWSKFPSWILQTSI